MVLGVLFLVVKLLDETAHTHRFMGGLLSVAVAVATQLVEIQELQDFLVEVVAVAKIITVLMGLGLEHLGKVMQEGRCLVR